MGIKPIQIYLTPKSSNDLVWNSNEAIGAKTKSFKIDLSTARNPLNALWRLLIYAYEHNTSIDNYPQS